jgi:hypothetical protein
VVLDSAVQFNILTIPFTSIEAETGLAFNAALHPIMEVLNDGHLTPEVRFTIGAYGVGGQVDRYGILMFSFWDPAVAETMAAYEASADFLRNIELSQSDLDRFIISVFANATAPRGELTRAMQAAIQQRLGVPANQMADTLVAIRDTTLDDFAALADALDLVVEHGTWITAGSASAIYAHTELFDRIVYAFGETGDEPRGISRLELLQTLIGDIDGLYEIAIDAGLILDIGSPFDTLTREEFAFVLIMASGGAELFVEADIEIADADEISEWAYEAVITALAFEALALDEAGYFHPQGIVTLEELWAVLN